MKRIAGLAVALSLTVAGCGARYARYHSGAEIPDGPGLFSGEKGAFVFHSGRQDKIETPAPSVSEEVKAGVDGTGATAAPVTNAPTSAEQQEFEEFKRWKAANRDSAEYREFREWRDWKAFQAWKKSTQK